MNRLRQIIAAVALIALLPWDAALALPSIPETPNCDFSGNVEVTKVMPDGTMYVGGNFSQVTCDGGVTTYNVSSIAKILSNGQFDPAWDGKGVIGRVFALEVDATRLYVGGNFSQVIGNGVNYGYNNIAALELTTGYADTSFMEEDIGAGTDGAVFAIINNTYANGIIIGGDFDFVTDSFVSLPVYGLGFLANDGLVSQSHGTLQLNDSTSYARDLVLDGSTLYVGGLFEKVSWDVGLVSRKNAFAADLSLDATADVNFVLPFDPEVDGEVRTMALDSANGRIFLAGDFTNAKVTTIPAMAQYLHPFFTATGDPEGIFGVWPDAPVNDIALENGELYVVGSFSNVFGSPRSYAASLDVSDVAVFLTAWDPSPDLNPITVSVAGSHGAIGGTFNAVGGLPAAYFARFETPVTTYSISGTVFEDINFGANAGRSKATAYAGGGLPVQNARVEFYDVASNGYLGFVMTDINGEYTWTAPAAGDYIVRVADDSVVSNRAQNTPVIGLMPVSTFFTDGGSQITNRVGGTDPSMNDHPSNNGSENFNDLDTGYDKPQTYGAVSVAGDVTGVDFGYNFSLVVNTNDAGRGSLRNAILNANYLSNTGLAQNGFASGVENIVFKIPNGTGSLGLNSAYNFFDGVENAAVIRLNADLPWIEETLYLDGKSQPSLPANTSTPIVLDSMGQQNGLLFTSTAPANHVRGISFVNANYASMTFATGSNEMSDNSFGVYPSGLQGAFTSYQLLFLSDEAGVGNTIGGSGEPNAFAYANDTYIQFNGTASNTVILSNYFGLRRDGISTGYCYNAIHFSQGGDDILIGGAGEGNVFGNCFSVGIRQSGGTMNRLKVQGNLFGTDADGITVYGIFQPYLLANVVDFHFGGNVAGEGNLLPSVSNPPYVDYATGTRIYGNTFGLNAVNATSSVYNSEAFTMGTASTDTEIGDGTFDGANVIAGGANGFRFYGTNLFPHHDVRIKGNKLGTDRTGMISLPINNAVSLYGIDGLIIGGVNPGEGNQFVSNSSALSVYETKGLQIYGNSCNVNADISGRLGNEYAGCLDLSYTPNAIVGAPGSGRNYFAAAQGALSVYAGEQVVIQNNFFNLNASGSAPIFQNATRGINLSSSTNTLIGGINPGERNYFGPHHGSLLVGDLGMHIDIQDNNGVWIQGNYLGTDATGTVPYEADFGIGVGGFSGDPVQNIVIGGPTPAHGNLIFGNMGIVLYGESVQGVIVQNNSIGADKNGVATSSGSQVTPLPFAALKPAGIAILWGASNNSIEDNLIVGTQSYAGGSGPGIYIPQDQTSPFGAVPTSYGNRISRNTFKDNAGLSIDIEDSPVALGGDGVTANDGIADVNRTQNGLDYPIITSSTLVGGTLFVEGHVGSALGLSAFANVEVEIYEQDDDGNQDGEVNVGDGLSIAHGEGWQYLGTVMTNGSDGNFSGSVPAPFLSSPTKITALAIDQDNNTSEFGVYFDGIIPPPVTPPVVTQGGVGGLSCNMSDPKNPGNGCQTLGQLSIFGLSTSSLPAISFVPDVPMPWLNGSTATTPVVCKPLITKYLRLGAKNDASQVKLLQQFLKEKDRSYAGAMSGVFDKATDTAVRAFQKKYSKDVLEPWGHKNPTGYVYITTSRKINALNCQ